MDVGSGGRSYREGRQRRVHLEAASKSLTRSSSVDLRCSQLARQEQRADYTTCHFDVAREQFLDIHIEL